MNDFDLESRLKGVPVPERTEEYWNDFPSQVSVQLHPRHPQPAPRRSWRPWLIWSADLALAAAMFFVCLQLHPWQTVSTAFARQENSIHRHLARIDAGLHRLVLNTDGMGYLLADAN